MWRLEHPEFSFLPIHLLSSKNKKSLILVAKLSFQEQQQDPNKQEVGD